MLFVVPISLGLVRRAAFTLHPLPCYRRLVTLRPETRWPSAR